MIEFRGSARGAADGASGAADGTQSEAGSSARPVFVDATEWGELLALLDAPYLQGLSEQFDGDASGVGGNEMCGQSFSV